MHNIKMIRKEPDVFDKAMVRRGLGPVSEEILMRDIQKRDSQTSLQDLQAQLNSCAKHIGELKSRGEDADAVIAQSKDIKAKIAMLKDQQSSTDEDPSVEVLDDLLITLPNILDDDVPDGDEEDDNVEMRRHGDLPEFSFQPKEHDELGEALGLMDFKQASKMSGSRFVILKGQLARLERALCQFMLDVHLNEFDYEEVSAPILVRDEAMFGSGQLPKFAEDSFATTGGYRLIPTAEVSLLNLVNDMIVPQEQLPLRYTACTPCFRSEAGSAGRDTRGMVRLHQFMKVELVSITDELSSNDEHERMTTCAEEILKRLEIPYRVMMLCSGDTGFCARRTYDIEVWLPGQGKYREISSCSNCGDFQGRRLKARYRGDDGENHYVHTLNGSGLPAGRTLVAVLENCQNEDGSITIPKALIPYMDGKASIEAI